jgi:NitT/TauT family transport system substrate-binding protein
MRTALAAAFAAAIALPSICEAVELNVTHFGTGMYGVPYAVAKEKGYFKEAGLDVTGFLTSAGGGTTVRNVLASELPYGDVALPAVIAAAQQGLELTIVHAGVASVADQVWITRKDDQRVKTVQDLAGKKLGPDRVARRRGRHDLCHAAGVGAREEQLPPRVQFHRVGAARDADRRRREDRVLEEEP